MFIPPILLDYFRRPAVVPLPGGRRRHRFCRQLVGPPNTSATCWQCGETNSAMRDDNYAEYWTVAIPHRREHLIHHRDDRSIGWSTANTTAVST